MFEKYGKIAGILAPIVSFLFIGIAIATHPWFSFTENALSDLGALHTENNWIFNLALILGGSLAMVFSLYLQKKGSNAIENAGYAAFMVASIFMTCIGVFPEGTPVHFTVSLLFYMFGAVAISISGIGFLISKRTYEGAASIILVSFGLLVALSVKWKGIAIPETIGALAIALWTYMLIFRVLKKDSLIFETD